MIIGIDLGTTNSLAAYFTPEGPRIIPNSFGENLTPSVVSVGGDGEVYVGKIARERQITHSEQTAAVFKRHMGSKKEYRLGGKTFLPEELSSFVIRKLKEDAEAFLGEKIDEAVISTPAYFNDMQRRATKTAGELAGLKVERIVNEPTAAAIAYGLHERPAEAKYLIFDLGGGTFDISILDYNDNVMEVRAVAGDNFLGGEDFTNALAAMFLYKNDLGDAELPPRERAILQKSAETAKKEFTAGKTVTMSYPHNGEMLNMTVNIDDFEKQCAFILNKLRAPVIRTLADASLKLADIDTVVLVGGATKLPIIRNFVSRLFGRLPASHINPDEVVALGAAVYAAMKERNEIIRELVLTDVCPFTLGTSVSVPSAKGVYQSGVYCPIIERNTVIPASRVSRVYTLYDNQQTVRVDVLQGESRKARENLFLGELVIRVPQGPAGKEALDIRYTYNVNGILEVEVTTVSTGKTEKLIIEKNPGAMTEEEIRQSLENLQSLKIHPREKDEYRYLLEKGERLYQELLGSARYEISSLLISFEATLEKQDPEEIAEAAAELKSFFQMLEDEDY
ncbi:MAG: molecular chaperone HscC [Gracilibacteraceae bacterium]|nr:molecular chaperone HscC [Gracilibacteraceae bacterium]